MVVKLARRNVRNLGLVESGRLAKGIIATRGKPKRGEISVDIGYKTVKTQGVLPEGLSSART